ncbi:Dipeptidyl peptidase IV (DPP IV) N-terminal region [Popillia japonica]|uniref:Dipeptidyl peptidase IV (DPP IV) N-terminal region n=1 Tax=Popillia japonica TaxID=7064 RepID=A0AAW1K289_POPJA
MFLSNEEHYSLQSENNQELLSQVKMLIGGNRLELPLGGEDAVLQYTTRVPTGNAVVLVSSINIYYKWDQFEGDLINVTTEGKEGNICKGAPDWVYEEEVFGPDHAMWFSENGRKLAYIKFNDDYTETMIIPYYGIPGSLDSQHTKAVHIRYPNNFQFLLKLKTDDSKIFNLTLQKNYPS